MKNMALAVLAVLGTVLFPFFLAEEGESKLEKIFLFLGGIIATVLLFPVFLVITFVEIREKENKEKKKKKLSEEATTTGMLALSPLGMTLLALILGRKR